MQSYLECNLVRNLKRNRFAPFVDVDKGKYFRPICKMIFVILIQAQTSNQRVYPIYPSLDKSSPTQNEFPYVCFDPHLRPTCIDRLSLGRSLLFSHLMQDN